MSGTHRAGVWLADKFTRDAAVSGVFHAVQRWKKQGMKLPVALALTRDVMRGQTIVVRATDDGFEFLPICAKPLLRENWWDDWREPGVKA